MVVDFSTLPDSAVFAILNPSSKEVYVSYSLSLKSRIGQIYTQLGEYINIEDTDLQLIILDSNPDKEHAELYTQYWIDYYTQEGYSFIRKNKLLRQYRPSIRILRSMKKVEVVLYDKGYRSRTVGIFTSVPEAKAFITTCYATSINKYTFPVYATNQLTRDGCKGGCTVST